jgi:hypothetical protein
MTGATAELAAEGECKWTWATYPSKEQQKRAQQEQARAAAGTSHGALVVAGSGAQPESAEDPGVDVPASPAVLAPPQPVLPEECEAVTPPLKKRAFPVM